MPHQAPALLLLTFPGMVMTWNICKISSTSLGDQNRRSLILNYAVAQMNLVLAARL